MAVSRLPTAVPVKVDGLPLMTIMRFVEEVSKSHDVTFKVEGRSGLIIIEPPDAAKYPALGRREEEGE